MIKFYKFFYHQFSSEFFDCHGSLFNVCDYVLTVSVLLMFPLLCFQMYSLD